jgi:CRISPR-associated endonuclease Csn1
MTLMADDASNSALHAAGYMRPDQREVNQRRFLPPSPNVANPIVRQALVEVRRTVNAVLRELVYASGHTLEKLHVELAREAKKSFDEREQLRFENAARQEARDDAADWIEDFDPQINPTRATVNRYLLWEEQEEFCPYCADKISPAQLFNGEADFDHILPRWRSLDDSMANKVVAHRRCNAEKGDHTPREWLEDSDPERYERALRVAERLPYGKQRKFQQKDVQLDDFVQRQLNDTAYISRCVSQYLRCLGARVVCTRGDMTADVRYWWGLNSILQTDGSDRKNRANHRHHAIDAIVIALTDDKRLFALANARGEDMPPPWDRFREEAARLILGINVSHRVQRRLHGALHEDTFYGATQKSPLGGAPGGEVQRAWAKEWIEDEGVFVRRKAVEALTKTQDLNKVRDRTVRETLRSHLRARGIDPDKPGKIPADAFKGRNAPRMLSGVPIRKVRMVESGETYRPVSQRRSYQFVKPGNNHHIVYRAVANAGRVQWAAEVVTMWDAAARAVKGLPLIDRCDRGEEQFLMSLSIGEMFEIDGDEGRRILCVVRKINQRIKRISYKVHTDARKADEIEADNLYLSIKQMQQRNARKVTVDPTGQVRRADATTATRRKS